MMMHPHRTYLILATFLLAVCLWLITQDAPGLCNDTSRLAAADALVNYGTLQIDQSYFNYTCDRIKVADHFFSDKPPVLAVLYAAGLFLVQNLFGLSLPDDLPLIYRLLSLLFAGLPFGVIAALLFRTSQRNRWPVVWGLFFAIGLPACTQLLVFSSTLNSHIVGGMLVLWALVRFTKTNKTHGLGFLMGLLSSSIHSPSHLWSPGVCANGACSLTKKIGSRRAPGFSCLFSPTAYFVGSLPSTLLRLT